MRIGARVKKTVVAFVLLLSLMIGHLSISPLHTAAFSGQVIQKGASGDDVIELQARLKYIGYYKGKIDGVYGWGTYWAVRNFQNAFGLPIDGLVGQTTKNKLIKASKYDKSSVKNQIRNGKKSNSNQKATAASVPGGFSQNDISLMANAVHGEARGEPYEGQVAVAAVILNRIASQNFPNTVSGVIFEPRAFTAVADGQIWLTPNETSKRAVIDAINGWDPTGDALYYFNPDTATSKWIWTRPQIKRIGKHIFCE